VPSRTRKADQCFTVLFLQYNAANLRSHTVVPGSAVVHIDVRTLPGQDEQYVLHHVSKALSGLRNADGTDYVYKVLPCEHCNLQTLFAYLQL
jgi:acetylornithine deacetylase/succinyl-diaminopimelate desuccinylase-like protein